MRELTLRKSGLPRAFRSHLGHDGHVYRRYLSALLERLGSLPDDAFPTLREAGRAVVELEHLGEDLERARARRRVREARSARRQQFALREQLTRLERRLEELAVKQPGDPVAAVRQAVEEANRP